MMEIYITENKLKSLKAIGEGSEGIVYTTHNGILYKVYKTKSYVTLDSEHLKKRYSPRIIIDAANRQKDIQYSRLPIAPLYIDGKFRGCGLYHHHGAVNIYHINVLPKSVKINILRKLIKNVKELTDHYIYHLDLANKNTSFGLESGTHSNVLIGVNLQPQIIDLDGKSTTYTPGYDEEYYKMTLTTLFTLINDLLFEIDFDECTMDDVEFLIKELRRIGIPKDISENIAYQKEVDYGDINELLDVADKCKKLTINI